MISYGFIQLGSSVISAIALTSIAVSFYSIRKEANFFNECVKEVIKEGKITSSAVNFCKG